MDYILQGILVLIGFGSILFLAYITTRYIAGKSNMAMRGKYISIVETVSLGMDKRLHLIKVDKQFILIASSAKGIEFLTAVTLNDFDKYEEIKSASAFDFKSLFDKYIQAYKNKKSDKTGLNNEQDSTKKAEGENFKSNLNRLRVISERLDTQYPVGKDDITNEK